MQQHFCVGMTDEALPGLLEFAAYVAKVVNLAVVDDPIARLRVMHRLMCQRRKIQNREPAVAQADFGRAIAQQNRARIVRPAMGEGVGSALENAVGNAPVSCNDTEYSAHAR